MATTIDHLGKNRRVRVLQDFVDARGVKLRDGEIGIITSLDLDERDQTIRLELGRPSGIVRLVFSLGATTGPRNGRMRDYFEVLEDEPTALLPKVRGVRTMILPPSGPVRMPAVNNPWLKIALDPAKPDRLEEMESEMSRTITQIGSAASVAELYAERMRMFQRAGNEDRAVAAFKRAVSWMGTYASWATSGGEGAAMSLERDQFRQALARELGYDPLAPEGTQEHQP